MSNTAHKKMTQDYEKMTNVNSDKLKVYDQIMWGYELFLVTNLFPFDVVLKRIRTTNDKPIANRTSRNFPIKAHSQQNIDLKNGDEVHILRKKGDEFYEICIPQYINSDTRNLKIGDVGYQDRIANYVNTQSDISGIRFHNKCTIPIKIYLYREVPIKKGPGYGKPIENLLEAVVSGNDGLEYIGRSRNNVYLDNDGNGYKLGDTIRITIGDQEYMKFQLPDQKAKDVYIGLVTQKYTHPPPDIAAYRVDRDNVLSTRYFQPENVISTQHRLARDPVDV